MSPDGTTEDQIDHLPIDKKSATSILDMRTRTRACCGSDQFLVQARFTYRINSKTQQKRHRQEKLDIDKLKEPSYQKRLEEEVERKLAEENNRNSSIEVKWNSLIKTSSHRSRGYKPHIALCRNATVGIIYDKQELKTTWKNYFENLLNRETNNENENIVVNQLQEEIPVDPPTINEGQNAISALRNGKAPGIDNMPSELLKLDSGNLLKAIHTLIEKIWNEEYIPSDWNRSIICPAWVLTQKHANAINIFEGKIPKKVLGFELYQYYKDPLLSEYIRIQRLQWARYVARMGEKSHINRRMRAPRPKGRPMKKIGR
ncbi:hypothetical protein ILUMI_25900 [Ignelater luminosus]|uniref:Uncharacterized protein n=1 Tax=Ignelater luminosus TaxID=2038154 RepID=A0A8K0C7J1_IGNLU|nr:hypothetical protein ILUMI_25900 [Ignelater luminosus]